jgi:hypothetical protein
MAGKEKSTPAPFVNAPFHNARWAEIDKDISDPWKQLKDLFIQQPSLSKNEERPNPTLLPNYGGDEYDRITLQNAVSAADILTRKLRAALESIPKAVEYTPTYYKKQFFAYSPYHCPAMPDHFWFNVSDKCMNHCIMNEAQKSEMRSHLLDVTWLCKVCIDTDLIDIKSEPGTYLEYVQNLYKTFDFTGFTGPTVSESVRFHNMLRSAKKFHHAFIHGTSSTRVSPGAVKKETHVKQEK